MKHIFYPAFIFCIAALSSCEEKKASGPGTMAPKSVSLPALTPSTPANTTPVAGGNIVATSTTPKLNPAHGKPGHRCDISVGAPLPDGPVQNVKAVTPIPALINSPVQAAAPAIQTAASTPVATVPAVTPGINPAHGQPGHRCDVAVGAPIPKTAAPITNKTTNSPVITPVVQNTPLIQPKAATTTAAVANGLNPAHGQPGHRCDIAVGKPLNSAPKKN